MQKSTFRGVEAAARHGWRWRIPCHAPVDIVESVQTLVARKLPRPGQVGSAAAISRNRLDQRDDFLATIFRQVVKFVSALSCLCESAIRLLYGLDRVRFRSERNFEPAVSDENEPLPSFRYAVVAGILHVPSHA